MEEFFAIACGNLSDPANPFARAFGYEERSEGSASTHLTSNVATNMDAWETMGFPPSVASTRNLSDTASMYSYTAADLQRFGTPTRIRVHEASSEEEEDELYGPQIRSNEPASHLHRRKDDAVRALAAQHDPAIVVMANAGEAGSVPITEIEIHRKRSWVSDAHGPNKRSTCVPTICWQRSNTGESITTIEDQSTRTEETNEKETDVKLATAQDSAITATTVTTDQSAMSSEDPRESPARTEQPVQHDENLNAKSETTFQPSASRDSDDASKQNSLSRTSTVTEEDDQSPVRLQQSDLQSNPSFDQEPNQDLEAQQTPDIVIAQEPTSTLEEFLEFQRQEYNKYGFCWEGIVANPQAENEATHCDKEDANSDSECSHPKEVVEEASSTIPMPCLYMITPAPPSLIDMDEEMQNLAEQPQLEAVDPILEYKDKKKIPFVCRTGFFLSSFLAIALLLLLGILLSKDKQGNTTAPVPNLSPSLLAPSMAPTISPSQMLPSVATSMPTMAPSEMVSTTPPALPPIVPPTMTPSQMVTLHAFLTTSIPTASPTHLIDLFLQTLPHYTMESLRYVESPQAKAFRWLFNQEVAATMDQWRQTQLFALATIYYALAGDSWALERKFTWLVLSKNRTECDWYSKSLYGQVDTLNYTLLPCNSRGEFQSLRLENLNLLSKEVFLPPEVELLTALREIEVSNSGIQADLARWIPTQLQQMAQLEELNLLANNFTGSIPKELPSAMARLVLDSNRLSGPIPSQIGKLIRLDARLGMRNNQLTGTIPTQLGLLTNLKELGLGSNKLLLGKIPSEFAMLTKLKELDLSELSLTGSIPTEVGSMIGLEKLDIHGSAITGKFATELCQLKALKELQLYENSITGSLPTELGELGFLGGLELQSNFFSGTIPVEIKSMVNLTKLDLSWNALFGSIPSEIGHLKKLEVLYLEGNSLSSALPTQLGNLPYLRSLTVHSNKKLAGFLPTELGLISTLQWMLLNENSFSGPIPSELALMPDLKGLFLQGNSLTGMIPSEFGSFRSLTTCHLGYNRLLSGPIPSEIGLVSSLEKLILVENAISGPIPTELATLSRLEELRADDNLLKGNIPSELALLTNLSSLVLNKNSLTGTIPIEFIELTSTMNYFDVSNNQLSGSVPEELCVFKNSFDCSYLLCGCSCICTR